jgi:hypothetical protein
MLASMLCHLLDQREVWECSASDLLAAKSEVAEAPHSCRVDLDRLQKSGWSSEEGCGVDDPRRS